MARPAPTSKHTKNRSLSLDAAGWLHPHPTVQHAPSPNHDSRPGRAVVSLLVLHNISLPPGEFGGDHVVQFFQNTLDFNSHPWFDNIRTLRVSAHFFIRRTGAIVQCVATTQRAWHAGGSRFRQRERCNDFSVGIELEGTDTLPYTSAQYRALRHLVHALRRRHPIRAVQGHEHIAPTRKTDPGPAFDWPRFQRENGWKPWQMPAT